MFRSPRSTLVVTLALAACGSGQATLAVAPAAPADSSPTERTAEQKARDDARAPLANALLDAYVNATPDFSPDRTKVVFASRRGENREYYLGDVANPSAPPVVITHGPERATSAFFSRDGKSIRFMRDTGADENFRIYQVGLDGTNERCLTPGPVLHRSQPFEARGKPGTLVYWQRNVKSPATDVVVQTIGRDTIGDPQVVYTDPGMADLDDITPDGMRVLLVHRTSSSDYVIYELDLGSRRARRLYPEAGKKVAIHDSSYSADGKTAFVAAE
jgi:Tol biopolymer transport system component